MCFSYEILKAYFFEAEELTILVPVYIYIYIYIYVCFV